MTHEEMATAAKELQSRSEAANNIVKEIAELKGFDVSLCEDVQNRAGRVVIGIHGEMLREVMRLGIAAAIESREIAVSDLLGNVPGSPHRCESCHGFGTPSGEAAGLVCGNCMGTGIEPDETPD